MELAEEFRMNLDKIACKRAFLKTFILDTANLFLSPDY